MSENIDNQVGPASYNPKLFLGTSQVLQSMLKNAPKYSFGQADTYRTAKSNEEEADEYN